MFSKDLLGGHIIVLKTLSHFLFSPLSLNCRDTVSDLCQGMIKPDGYLIGPYQESLFLVVRIRTSDPCGLNKGCGSKFCVGSWVQQTPEKGRRTYQPKHCEYNNKDEDNSPKNLNDKKAFFYFVPLLHTDCSWNNMEQYMYNSSSQDIFMYSFLLIPLTGNVYHALLPFIWIFFFNFYAINEISNVLSICK